MTKKINVVQWVTGVSCLLLCQASIFACSLPPVSMKHCVKTERSPKKQKKRVRLRLPIVKVAERNPFDDRMVREHFELYLKSLNVLKDFYQSSVSIAGFVDREFYSVNISRRLRGRCRAVFLYNLICVSADCVSRMKKLRKTSLVEAMKVICCQQIVSFMPESFSNLQWTRSDVNRFIALMQLSLKGLFAGERIQLCEKMQVLF